MDVVRVSRFKRRRSSSCSFLTRRCFNIESKTKTHNSVVFFFPVDFAMQRRISIDYISHSFNCQIINISHNFFL